MEKKSAYNYDDLIKCGNGELFGPGNAKLPLPPMLMFDRITEIEENKGAFRKGVLKAELDIKNELWFFDCHFKEDPVMPGCLGLDAMWQLLGFYLLWSGLPGIGRALGADNIKFFGQVLPSANEVKYKIDIKRIINRGAIVGLADGEMYVDNKIATYEIDMKRILVKEGTTVGLANGILKADDKKIYSAENLKVGLFK